MTGAAGGARGFGSRARRAGFTLHVLLALCLAPCACREPGPRAPEVAAARGAHPGSDLGPGASDPPSPVQLEFIDDFNPPRPQRGAGAPLVPAAAWDAALGGLSGLLYVEEQQRLYAVSDDGRRFAPRLYAFRVELGPGQLRVVPDAVLPLREAAPSGLLQETDMEAIAGSAERLFVSLEASDDRPTQRESRILELRHDGWIAGSVPVPPELLPAAEGQPARGTRSNRGLEGIALTPGGRWLWAITESSLEQDGPEADFEQGARVRLCRWELTGSGGGRAAATGVAPVQYIYPADPVRPRLLGAVCDRCGGVSDLVALDERRLLVMERAYVELSPEEQGRNLVRIFQVDVPSAPPGETPTLLSKRLVLDLDELLPRFDAGLQTLDNFEGMTLGPRTASGARSLLLVTDDNFRAQQRTVFLAFELRGG